MNNNSVVKIYLFSVALLLSHTMYASEENQLLEQSVQEKNKSLVRHLNINNAINGAITLGGLTTLGLASITNTDHYPLTTFSILAIGSLVQAGHNYYVTRKLYNNNINTENDTRIHKLVASGVMDIAINGVGTAVALGVQISNPQVNNVTTNLLLTVPMACFGYLWSGIYDKYQKYKKLQRTL